MFLKAEELVVNDGRVAGVKSTAANGTPYEFTANKAVIITIGGFHGGNRLGGNAVIEVMVTGRNAGTNASNELN